MEITKHKLAIEVDEKGHTDRPENEEKERENIIINKLGCRIIRINPHAKDYNIFIEIGKIHYHIKPTEKLTKESTEE